MAFAYLEIFYMITRARLVSLGGRRYYCMDSMDGGDTRRLQSVHIFIWKPYNIRQEKTHSHSLEMEMKIGRSRRCKYGKEGFPNSQENL